MGNSYPWREKQKSLLSKLPFSYDLCTYVIGNMPRIEDADVLHDGRENYLSAVDKLSDFEVRLNAKKARAKAVTDKAHLLHRALALSRDEGRREANHVFRGGRGGFRGGRGGGRGGRGGGHGGRGGRGGTYARKCWRCDSPDHVKRDCPVPKPTCEHCGFEDGHKSDDCYHKPHGTSTANPPSTTAEANAFIESIYGDVKFSDTVDIPDASGFVAVGRTMDELTEYEFVDDADINIEDTEALPSVDEYHH